MNCEECLLILDEYADSELDEKSAVRVSAHINDCLACASEYEMLRREQQIYSQYPLEVEATPALWANIQANIEEIRRERTALGSFGYRLANFFGVSTFNPTFAAVPFVLLLITLGIIIGLIKYKSAEKTFSEETVFQKTGVQYAPEKIGNSQKNETQSLIKKDDILKSKDKTLIVRVENRMKRNIARPNFPKPKKQFINSESIGSDRKMTTDEVVEKAERQYKGAIAILSGDIKLRRAQLSPNLISQFEQSLAEIDRTINETKRAVRTQPNDPVAIQYMTTAYAKKIELLRTIAGN
jgi:uncharacterized membrane protein